MKVGDLVKFKSGKNQNVFLVVKVAAYDISHLQKVWVYPDPDSVHLTLSVVPGDRFFYSHFFEVINESKSRRFG